jgi:hypothetical protein
MPETRYNLTNASGEWEYVPLTDEELADIETTRVAALTDFSHTRSQRDQTLSECDWTQVTDVALDSAKVAEWAAYRTLLRDLPASAATVPEIVWPTPPE